MNPWLSIPATDYIDHMEHESVAQGVMLRQHLADCVSRTSAKSLLFLGAGIGNGLESDILRGLATILAVDINPEYLSILKQRHPDLPVCVSCCKFPEDFSAEGQFDLVYGALFFEYVDLRASLQRLRQHLRDGRLIVLLQQPSEKSSVTETGIRSLSLLRDAMTIIPAAEFINTACEHGYRMISQRRLTQVSKTFAEIELELA